MVDWPVASLVKAVNWAPRMLLACSTVILTDCQSPAGEIGVAVRLFDESHEVKVDKVSSEGATNAST